MDERYLYQGWNLIAVYHPGETEPAETYTWGKDLSGSLHGAGGVGGLLFAKKRGHGQDAWIYHYDGNGNVAEVTDSQGNLLDHYEYDPFGNLTTTPQLPEGRYRFSTKPLDAESGFYYYGYRYYDAADGRWYSRDPIGERGGPNLYATVENSVVNAVDGLGLARVRATATMMDRDLVLDAIYGPSWATMSHFIAKKNHRAFCFTEARRAPSFAPRRATRAPATLPRPITVLEVIVAQPMKLTAAEAIDPSPDLSHLQSENSGDGRWWPTVPSPGQKHCGDLEEGEIFEPPSLLEFVSQANNGCFRELDW